MVNLPNCPECDSAYTYEDGFAYVCPECTYEWTTEVEAETNNEKVYRDANGNVLTDGDAVTVIKT